MADAPTILQALLSFGAIQVKPVAAGTAIVDERSGRQLVVTENTAVSQGGILWCTELAYENLKARISALNPPKDTTNG